MITRLSLNVYLLVQISSPSKQSPKKRNIVQAVLSPTKVKITSPEKMIHSINSPVKNKQHQKRVKTGSRRGRKKRNLLPERGISIHKQSNLAHSSEIQMQSNHVEVNYAEVYCTNYLNAAV